MASKSVMLEDRAPEGEALRSRAIRESGVEEK